MSTGVIILAAGSASRMKKPKMLLPFRNTNLLSHLLREVQAIRPDHSCLVTGMYHAIISDTLQQEETDMVYNEHWATGMSSSIKKGLDTLLKKDQALSDLFIVVSDQPFLDRNLLLNMKALRTESKKGIIAARYGAVTGTPVLFNKKYFSELMNLEGDTGARSILKRHTADTATVDFPAGSIDIDTPEDYEKLCAQMKNLKD